MTENDARGICHVLHPFIQIVYHFLIKPSGVSFRSMFRTIILVLLSVTCVLGLSPIANVRRAIDRVAKENFATVTKEVEPFLSAEAGTTFYAKSMKRLSHKAKAFGMDMPKTYAQDAKATEKRRMKQDAFIKSKVPEPIASE